MRDKIKNGFGLIYVILLVSALTVLGAMTMGIVYNSGSSIRLALLHEKNITK